MLSPSSSSPLSLRKKSPAKKTRAKKQRRSLQPRTLFLPPTMLFPLPSAMRFLSQPLALPAFPSPAATAQCTQDNIRDFMDITGASAAQAQLTINRALALGLSVDHAVEYYLQRA